MLSRHRLVLLLGLVPLLAGCGSSNPVPPPAAARLVAQRGVPNGVIVLSALGAQRIGLTTTATRPARRDVLVPASAIVYDPSGRPLTFVRRAPLQFTEQPVVVDRFLGGEVLLRRGPAAGAQVVSVGAEELFGVQSGVLAQT